MRAPDLDAAAAFLADGPRPDVDLLDALGFAAADEHEVLDVLHALRSDGRIVLLADGRAARADLLLDGVVSWHRVTAAEVDERALELGDAALVLAASVRRMDPVIVGDAEVALREPTDAAGEPDRTRGPLLDLPADWRPDLVAGDLVGFGAVDGGLALVDGEPPATPAGSSAADDGGPAALVEAVLGLVGDHSTPVLHLDDPAAHEDGAAPGLAAALVAGGRWVLELDVIAPLLLADHGGAVRALGAPVAEVLAEADLRVDDGNVLGPAVDAESGAIHALGRELVTIAFPGRELETGQAEGAGMAWAALHSEQHAEPAAVALLLADPVVAEAVAARLEGESDDVLAAAAARLDEVVRSGADTRGAAYVLARALVVVGRVEAARDVVEGAFADVPDDWEVGAEMVALFHAIAGDVDGAVSVYRALQEWGVADRLAQWRPTPPTGVGRNDPCPCGSGRKFKQCCQRNPPRPDLDARVPFLWWKLEMTTVELYGLDLPEVSGPLPSEQIGMVAVDGLLLEDEAIVDVGRLVGPLLPDDERELLGRWGVPTRSVFEVQGQEGDDLVLTDLVAEDVHRVALDAVDHAHDGATIVAVLVPGASTHQHVVGPVVHLPSTARDEAVEAIVEGIDAQQLVDLIGHLVATAPDAHLH